jgi:hypothetical protein
VSAHIALIFVIKSYNNYYSVNDFLNQLVDKKYNTTIMVKGKAIPVSGHGGP